MVKEFRLYQYYPSGNVVFRGLSTDLGFLKKIKADLEEKNPSAEYKFHKLKPTVMSKEYERQTE